MHNKPYFLVFQMKYLVGLLLLLPLLRGTLIFYTSGWKTIIHYGSVVGLVSLGTLISIKMLFFYRNTHQYIKIYLICFISLFYFFVSKSLMGSFDLAVAYQFLFLALPIFLADFDLRYLKNIIWTQYIIFLFTGFNYLIVTKLNYYAAASFYEKVSIISSDAIPHVAGVAAIGGVIGDNHDFSAVGLILTLFVYCQIYSQVPFRKKFVFFILYLLGVVLMFLSLSAANITLLIFYNVIFMLWHIRKIETQFVVVFYCILVFLYYVIAADLIFVVTGFLNKYNLAEGGSLAGFSNGFTSLGSKEIFSLVFGFGYLLESGFIKSEIALVKNVTSWGIFIFSTLLFCLFYPVIYGLKNRQKLKIHKADFFMYSVLMVVHFSTMAHYGSFFRITNIPIWAVCCACIIKASGLQTALWKKRCVG